MDNINTNTDIAPLPGEEFRTVTTFPHNSVEYDLSEICQVSNYGRVKSVPREITLPNRTIRQTREIIRTLTILNSKITVLLKHQQQGIKITVAVARLVAFAFLPIPQGQDFDDLCVIHRDYNPHNNRADNLQYLTREEFNHWRRTNENSLKHKIFTLFDQGKTLKEAREILNINEGASYFYSTMWKKANGDKSFPLSPKK